MRGRPGSRWFQCRRRRAFALAILPALWLAGPQVTVATEAGQDAGRSTAAAPIKPKVMVVAASAMRLHSRGTDRWDVWVCRVPPNTLADDFSDVSPRRLPISPRRAVRRLRRVIAPWFRAMAEGRYRPVFRPRKAIILNRKQGARPCGERARRGSRGRDGALVVTNLVASGPTWAGPDNCAEEPTRRRPGRICAGYPHTLPGSGRMGWIPASTLIKAFPSGPHYSTAAHELGHALAWPHSFTGRLFIPVEGHEETRVGIEYDDPFDLMGYERLWGTGSWWSPKKGDYRLKGTQAFNRLAAGWIRRRQVAVHREPARTYRLRPIGHAGTRVVVVPAGDRRAFLTLEARVRRGYDRTLPFAGVNVHAVDQRGRACTFADRFRSCWGDWRRQVPLPPRPDSLASMIRPGQTMRSAGLRIRNLGHLKGGGFRVRVEGRRARLPLIKPSGCMLLPDLCPGRGPWGPTLSGSAHALTAGTPVPRPDGPHPPDPENHR